jgi:hypothetical protein
MIPEVNNPTAIIIDEINITGKATSEADPNRSHINTRKHVEKLIETRVFEKYFFNG